MFFLFTSCQPKQNENTIIVWHWMTDRQPVFEELSKIYYQKTGITVRFELYAPSEAYAQKVRSAAQGRNLPDIFGILGEKREFASFIKANLILDLTPYMEKDFSNWKNSFFPEAIMVNEFKKNNTYGVKPGVYGVPIDVMTIQLLYNKKLFEKIGLDPEKPPQDFDEFLKIGEKINDKDFLGLVSGWSEIWLIECFLTSYAINIMGYEKVIDTIKGKVSYTDSDWIKVFELFQKMREAKLLSNDIVGMVNKTAEQIFANNKALFAFNGSWCVNVYKTMNPKLEYGVFLPPKVNKDNPMVIRGGAGSSFMVNSASTKKEKAIEFLRWLTETEQQIYLAKATNNLPANKYSLKELLGPLVDFLKGMEYATHPNIWEIREKAEVIEAIGSGVQLIILGKKSAKEVAEEVQRIKERNF
ncbi:MAG: extracellular solute-binding protein [Candidatus Omnitrophica bacterium]|nr:extracellular solute-binding protein [Candidatus Omnitrophota bacterium]